MSTERTPSENKGTPAAAGPLGGNKKKFGERSQAIRDETEALRAKNAGPIEQIGVQTYRDALAGKPAPEKKARTPKIVPFKARKSPEKPQPPVPPNLPTGEDGPVDEMWPQIDIEKAIKDSQSPTREEMLAADKKNQETQKEAREFENAASYLRSLSDKDLGKIGSAILAEKHKREAELDGGAEPYGGQTEENPLRKLISSLGEKKLKTLEQAATIAVGERNRKRQVAGADDVMNMSPEEWKEEVRQSKASREKGNIPEETPVAAWEEHGKEMEKAAKRKETMAKIEEKAAGITTRIENAGKPPKVELKQDDLEAHKAAAAAMEAKVMEKAKATGDKNIMGTLLRWNTAYQGLPLKYKLLVGGVFIAGSFITGMPLNLIQRGVGAFGAGVAAEGIAKKYTNNKYIRGAAAAGAAAAYFFAIPMVSQFAVEKTGGAVDWIKSWFTTAPATPEWTEWTPKKEFTGSESWPPAVPLDAPATPPVAEAAPAAPAGPPFTLAFDGEARVGKNGNLWRIVAERLEDTKEFRGLDRAQKDFVLDSYIKHADSLGKDWAKSIGIGSGNIHLLQPGETLNLKDLNNQSMFDDFIDKAQKLTDAQRNNILREALKVRR